MDIKYMEYPTIEGNVSYRPMKIKGKVSYRPLERDREAIINIIAKNKEGILKGENKNQIWSITRSINSFNKEYPDHKIEIPDYYDTPNISMDESWDRRDGRAAEIYGDKKGGKSRRMKKSRRQTKKSRRRMNKSRRRVRM